MSDTVQIQSIMLSEGRVEISYLEDRDVNEWGILGKTAVIPITEDTELELTELVDAATALLDHWLGLRRNPTAPKGRRGRPSDE